jgi:hypothetical protein
MQANEHKNLLYDFLIEPGFRTGRHVLFTVTFSFIAIGQSLFVFGDQPAVSGSKIYLYAAGNTIVITAFAYMNLYFLAPRLLLKNRYAEYFMVLLAATTIYLICKGIIESRMLAGMGITRNFTWVTALDVFSNLALYAICIASSSITVLFRQWIADTERINGLKNRQLKAGVDELKNRINPKSLSGVLEYVSEQVKTNPEEASEILFRLSDVLRYELYDCKREKVLLDSDIEFIDKYLALEQLNRPGFKYKTVGKGRTNPFIPPFSFLPVIQELIERQPAHMLLIFDADDKSVHFRCEVSGAGLPAGCDFHGTDVTELHLNIC